MRSILTVAILLSIAAAYYIYLPLPSTISEPWKLMFMDAILRGVMHAVSFCICFHYRICIICHFNVDTVFKELEI